jgi:hypothetical protein
MINSKRMRWTGHVARMEIRGMNCKWVDNIKMYLREIRWIGAD